MKLHLPKSLLVAVLAACVAPAAWAGSWGGDNGDCYTFTGADDATSLDTTGNEYISATWIRAGAANLTPTLTEVKLDNGITLNISGKWAKTATTEAFTLLTIDKLNIGEGVGTGALVIANNANGGNMPVQTVQINNIEGSFSKIEILEKGKLIAAGVNVLTSMASATEKVKVDGTLELTAGNALEKGNVILNSTGTGVITSGAAVTIGSTSNSETNVSSDFVGTITMTGGTLSLGDSRGGTYYKHSVNLSGASIKLTNAANLYAFGDNLLVKKIQVAGNGETEIKLHEARTEGQHGLRVGELQLDSNVRICANWGADFSIERLTGEGELRAWFNNTSSNNRNITLNIDSVNNFSGNMVLGKNADGELTHYVTTNIGAAGTTSVISGSISNYGTLHIGTAAADGEEASSMSLLSTIENGGTLSLSGNIILGEDMSKYTIAQPAEGGSYSYDDNNGFYTADGSSYYLVEGNADNITLNTQQAALGESTVTLEKKLDGVVFENANTSTSAEFFITEGELTRSALIQATETTRVTDSTAFQVKGNGVLVLSNERASADLMTIEGEGKVKVTETATLTNANALANSVIGNGTIELSYDTSYSSVPNAGADFTGTTHVKAGYFTINGASFGNKLVLDNGVNFRLNNADATLAADKELVLNGTSEVHQNNSSNFTVNGVVSGAGTYARRGGGTLTFNNSVTLGAFKQETTSGSTIFQGNSVTLGNLEVETQELTIAADTATIGVNGTTFLENGSNHATGLYIKNSVVNIGNGTDSTIVTTTRVEMGDNESGDGGTLNVKANAALIVTRSDVSDGYHTTGFLLGEWGANSTLAIYGKLLSQNASIMCGNVKGTVTVEDGGFLATKGFLNNKNNDGSLELTLADGGEIVLGSTGISAKTITTTFGAGTVGISSDSSISKDVTLNSTAGTTFDTTKWIWAEGGASIAKGNDGGTMTITGVISGSGKLIKDGFGTLKLNAANTYAGGTEVKEGILTIGKGSALGNGATTVMSGATLKADYDQAGEDITITGTITLQDGATLMVLNGYAANQNKQFGINININGTSTLESGWGGSHGALAGGITGVGTLKLIQPVWSGGASGYSEDAWKLLSDISDKSETEKLAISTNAHVTLSGTNTYSGGTTVLGRTLVAATGAALGKGDVTISGGSLVITDDAVTVTKRVTDTSATIARISEASDEAGNTYSAGNAAYEVCNASVAVESSEDKTISNRLTNVALTNTGTGTLNVTGTDNTLTELHALNGSVNVSGQDELVLNALTIAKNNTLTVDTVAVGGSSVVYSAENTGATATLEGGATINGSLNLSNASSLTLNGISKGSLVKIDGDLILPGASETPTLTLSGDILNSLAAMNLGDKLGIFSVRGGFFVGDTEYTNIPDATDGIALNTVFSASGDFNFEGYYLGFIPDEAGYSTVYIGKIVPEPTTATLSLLALAALAARRRRASR